MHRGGRRRRRRRRSMSMSMKVYTVPDTAET
jgi:hypothetical protein